MHAYTHKCDMHVHVPRPACMQIHMHRPACMHIHTRDSIVCGRIISQRNEETFNTSPSLPSPLPLPPSLLPACIPPSLACALSLSLSLSFYLFLSLPPSPSLTPPPSLSLLESVRERVCTVKAMLTPIRASYGRDADASARQRFAALVPRAAAGRKRPAAARGLCP